MTDEQSEQQWPKMPDKFYEALGWMHAECCGMLDRGEDPRVSDPADMIPRCIRDLTRDSQHEEQSDGD